MTRKKFILLTLFIAACLAVVLNIKTVFNIFPWLWHVFEVLVIGGAIAFVVNIIMDFFSSKVFTETRILNEKVRKTLCLVCSLLVIIIVIVAIILIVIPQLVESFKLLFERIPPVLDSLRTFLENNTRAGSALRSVLADFKTHSSSISSSAVNIVKNSLPKTFTAAYSGVRSIMNIVIALIFSLYILIFKQSLQVQARKLCYAYLPEKIANKTLYIAHLTSRNFKDFIYGRFVDALSMAVIYAVAALILRIPNTLMITTLIAVFCLIPLFGALIAWIIGVFIIVTVSPVKAIIFTVLIVVIMLFARNVIYPRVIGTSIGLPDIWVLAAIIVGGKMAGLLGMITAVPIFGVIYTLIQENQNKRLKEHDVKTEEYAIQPNWDNFNPETNEFDEKNNKD